MSTINGLGKHDLTIPVPRPVPTTSDSDSFLSLMDPTAQTSTAGSSTASSSSSASSQQQDEDRQEAFAKMMVSLQNSNSLVAAPTTSDSSSDGSVGQVGNSSLSALTDTASTSSGKSATDEFKDYMALTPAQKMRYSTLKSMGLTEADLKALPPADKAKVEAKIADVIKKQTEMQASASSGTDANSSSSSSTGDKGQSLVNAALLNMTESLSQEKSKLNPSSV